MRKKILVVRKMSANEFYYKGKHPSQLIQESSAVHDNTVLEIGKSLRKSKQDFAVVTRDELSEDLVSQYDCVISAGGDGTVIATAFYNKDTPQLNLKTDQRSLGALCRPDFGQALNEFLNDEYALEFWDRQNVFLDGKFIGRALNEVCVGEQLKFSKLAKYALNYFDWVSGNRKEEDQSASGLIIATGTGSSGWPSAFKQFSRDAGYFEFRTLLQNKGVLNHGLCSDIEVIYKGHEGKFSIDTVEFDFPRDSRLKIQRSEYPLRVVVSARK
ncbi:NAD kinase [uncultured archaeon]|nr:NAD kinase [uncultured archaeon]